MFEQYDYNDERVRATVLRRFSPLDGAGVDLRGCESYEDAIQTAGLDFVVNQAGIRVNGGTWDGKEIEGKKLNIREDTGEILGLVSDHYNPVMHKDAFAVAEEMVKSGDGIYECGGIGRANKDAPRSTKGFLVVRHEDFDVDGDQFQSFTVFQNQLDGFGGVSIKFFNLRLVCMNGMVDNWLGDLVPEIQVRNSIRHSKDVMERIQVASQLALAQREAVKQYQKMAEKMMDVKISAEDFRREFLPKVLETLGIKDTEDRQRGRDRLEQTVESVLRAYDAEDTQNYNGTAYKILLTMSDLDSHLAQRRNTGNSQVYFNRVLQVGMAANLYNTIGRYIVQSRGIKLA